MDYSSNYQYSDSNRNQSGSGQLHVKGAMTKAPRGLRNNNPLNIRHSASKWQGMTERQTDRLFVQFKSLAYGFRAAFKLILTYMTKYKLTNITQIIMRWAPPNENNTSAYVATVSRMSGIHPTEPLDFNNRDQMIPLVRAMAYMENGCIIDGDSIRQGYAMVNSPPKT